MAMAVAALGTVAGSLAGSAIAGKPLGTTIGGGTGVTSTTITQGSKKNPQKTVVPQADISSALDYFQQAADAQKQGLTQGLNYYTSAMDKARQDIENGYLAAKAPLEGLSYAGNQAMNEMMRYMGMAPLSATSNASTLAKSAGLGQDIQNQIAQAEKLTNPGDRAAALQTIQTAINQQVSDKQAKINQLNQQSQAGSPDIQQFQNAKIMATAKGNAASGGQPYYLLEGMKRYVSQAEMDSINAQRKQAYDAQVAQQNDQYRSGIQGQIDTLNSESNTYNDFLNNYSNNFQVTPDTGYTGDQVTQQLEATPGYQFQLNQGLQAVERRAAATGMLGSGNTLAAINDYAQGQAQSYFNQHINTLNSIAQLGSAASSQLSNQAVQKGQNLSDLNSQQGLVGLQTYSNMGTAQANAYNNMGNLSGQAAMFNTGLVNQALASQKAGQQSLAQQAIASGPSYQQQGLAQSAFNYRVFQNQQAGQAYQNALSQSNPYGLNI